MAKSSPVPAEASPAGRLDEHDYQTLLATLSATTLGRAFLDEFSRRQRLEETETLMAAVARVEAMLAAQKDASTEPARAVPLHLAVVSPSAPEAKAEAQAAPTAEPETQAAAAAEEPVAEPDVISFSEPEAEPELKMAAAPGQALARLAIDTRPEPPRDIQAAHFAAAPDGVASPSEPAPAAQAEACAAAEPIQTTATDRIETSSPADEPQAETSAEAEPIETTAEPDVFAPPSEPEQQADMSNVTEPAQAVVASDVVSSPSELQPQPQAETPAETAIAAEPAQAAAPDIVAHAGPQPLFVGRTEPVSIASVPEVSWFEGASKPAADRPAPAIADEEAAIVADEPAPVAADDESPITADEPAPAAAEDEPVPAVADEQPAAVDDAAVASEEQLSDDAGPDAAESVPAESEADAPDAPAEPQPSPYEQLMILTDEERIALFS